MDLEQIFYEDFEVAEDDPYAPSKKFIKEELDIDQNDSSVQNW